MKIHLSSELERRNLHLPFATQLYFLPAVDVGDVEANLHRGGAGLPEGLSSYLGTSLLFPSSSKAA